jgi:hypothetical protein
VYRPAGGGARLHRGRCARRRRRVLKNLSYRVFTKSARIRPYPSRLGDVLVAIFAAQGQ